MIWVRFVGCRSEFVKVAILSAFLAALYSFMEKDLLAHDAFSCSNCPATGGGPCAGTGRPYHSSVPFPSVRAGKEHVGAVSNPHA